MNQQTLLIPDSIYKALLDTAKSEGLSPIDWIASRLASEHQMSERSVDIPEELIGSMDSSKEPVSQRENSEFGSILKAKYEKQGFRFP